MQGTVSSARVERFSEQWLPLLRAAVKDQPNRLEQALRAYPSEQDRLFEFMDRHRLSGWLYRVLVGHGLTELLATRQREQARHFYLRQWSKNERLTGELARLWSRFERAGAELISLKGPIFAERFYGDLDARAISDLDLLVRQEADLERVERGLLAEGYALESRLLLGRRVSRFFTHHFEYRKGEVSVEVHWVLQQHPSLAIDYGRLWHESELLSFRGRPFRVLSSEDEVLVQLLTLLVDWQVGKLTLKSFVDLYRVVEVSDDRIEWERFLVRSRRERVFKLAHYFLSLLLELWQCADDFPALARALRAAKPATPAASGGIPTSMLAGSRLDGRQKLAALRLYDTPLVLALGWWAVSLPFRLAVYHRETARLLQSG